MARPNVCEKTGTYFQLVITGIIWLRGYKTLFDESGGGTIPGPGVKILSIIQLTVIEVTSLQIVISFSLIQDKRNQPSNFPTWEYYLLTIGDNEHLWRKNV